MSRSWIMRTAVLILVAVCLSALASAQQQKPPEQNPTEYNPPDYSPDGKRDPFLAPRQAKDDEPQIVAPPPLDKRPPGLSGLLVSEVTVAGMAGTHQDKVVILKGVDKVSYLARKGSKLFDGYLQVINDNEVVFQREVVDTKGNKRISKVVKRLFTEDK